MSVILTYKTKDKIYLCADNRTSTEEGTPISDDLQKIIMLNENVAVAFAGYGASQTAFDNITKDIRDGKKDCRVEDVLKILKVLYWTCKVPWNKKYTKNFMRLSSRFIVAGKNKKDEYCIYTMGLGLSH